MRRFLFAFVIALSAFVIALSAFVVGCRKDDSTDSEEISRPKKKIDKKTEAELKAVVEADMKAMEDEDIEAVLKNYATEDAAQLAATRATLKAMFEKYDLSYKLIDFKVISCDGDDAVVEVIQESRKIRGPEYQDIRMTMETKMKKKASGWKLVSSKRKKMDALDSSDSENGRTNSVSAKIDKKTEAELKAVIKADMQAMDDEDIEAVLKNYATEDAAQLAATRATLKTLFKTYDFSYKVIDFKVISCDGENAVVEAVVETRKIRGPEYQDNRSTVETKLKKTSSGWKQVSSKIKKMDFI